jgi:carboxypeptidase family protein/TonB-dependent receptor-like protein
MRKTLGPALAILVLAAPGLMAQPAATGNIYGSVSDESAAVLPSATITLSGATGTRATTAGSLGDFRFLAVSHGTHKLTVALTGFTTVERGVIVAIGQNLDLRFTLKLASFAETITVPTETPVVDTKKVGNLTTITKDELARIPTARDPWGILQTVAGVQVDRVNLAGNESGAQAVYTGKGADPKNNTWAIDGLNITDMSVFGTSPTYYTYDAFDQVSVTTGGNDVTLATGGVGIGFVTKRGTNDWHGNAVGYLTHDDFQSSNLPDELRNDPRLQGSDKADHTEQITDYNFDLGGPILKDELWIYGSWGRQDIRIKRLTQTRDKTEVVTKTAKLNWQASSKDMISAFWFMGSKIKIGRSPGTGLTEPAEFLVDQGDLFPRQPHGLSKIEWSRSFSPNFFLSGKWAYFSNGFTLAGRGNQDAAINFRTNTASGNSNSSNSLRPQTTWQLDGHYFFSGWGGSHQLRLGASYRKIGSFNETIFPGNKTRAFFHTNLQDRARFFRDIRSETESKYYSIYAADTLTRGRLNLTLGLRFDLQRGYAKPSSADANPLVPDLLPGIDFPGGGEGIEWSDVSPRLGATYALDEARRTIVRLSVARYAGQLQNSYAAFDSPVGGVSFLEYPWRDQNGDEKIQTSEVNFGAPPFAVGVDANNPGVATTPDRIDPDLGSDNDYELIVGIDREVAGDLALGLSYTWRRNVDTFTRGLDSTWVPRIGVTADDYELGAPVTRNGYTIVPYTLRAGVTTRPGVTGGRILTERPDFYREYHGLELTLTKRLSRRWMARLAASYMDWTDHLESPLGHFPNPNPIDLDPGFDGGAALRFSSGNNKALYVGGKWQVAANALYQIGFGFEVAANFFARQGYPRPIYIQVNTGDFEGTTNVLAVPEGDSERLADLYDLDLSLAKSFKFGGTNLTLRVECFNVSNSNTELFRVVNAGSNAFNQLDEILAPRIFRIGARFGF